MLKYEIITQKNGEYADEDSAAAVAESVQMLDENLDKEIRDAGQKLAVEWEEKKSKTPKKKKGFFSRGSDDENKKEEKDKKKKAADDDDDDDDLFSKM